MIRFFLFFALFALLACKQSVDYRDFALAYAELRIAEQEYEETDNGKAVRFQILQKHNLDVNAFEEKIEALKKEPAKWAEFQTTFAAILDSIAASSKIEE